MTATFKDFGEAAKLYAQYKSVVDEMQKACEADIAAFHEELRQQLEEQFPGFELGEELSKTSRCWWVKLPGEKSDEVPYVYTPPADIRIVAERRLWVSLWWDTTDGFKEQLNAAAGAIKLPSHCRVDRAYGVFAMTIELGADPVAAAVEPLRMLLAAIHELRVSTEKPRSKRAKQNHL